MMREEVKKLQVEITIDDLCTNLNKVSPLVLHISEREKVDMRTAALILGIGRVAEATRLRGIYP